MLTLEIIRLLAELVFVIPSWPIQLIIYPIIIAHFLITTYALKTTPNLLTSLRASHSPS